MLNGILYVSIKLFCNSNCVHFCSHNIEFWWQREHSLVVSVHACCACSLVLLSPFPLA